MFAILGNRRFVTPVVVVQLHHFAGYDEVCRRFISTEPVGDRMRRREDGCRGWIVGMFVRGWGYVELSRAARRKFDLAPPVTQLFVPLEQTEDGVLYYSCHSPSPEVSL
jgi:hypothetical protein